MYKGYLNWTHFNCRFLLVEFQLTFILTSREPRKRLEAVSHIPLDLADAYFDVIDRVKPSDKSLAFKVLSWLFHAMRPLLMDELREAMGVEFGDVHLDP